MKLVLTLLVRDEEDIIRENVLYHLDRGVDFVIVTDNLSVDRTTEILQEFVAQRVVAVIREDEDTYAQHKWVTRMARLAKTEYGADWVINSDADEFWWATSGDLKDAIQSVPPEFDVVSAKRCNFCALAGGSSPWFEHMVYRTVESLNPLGEPLPPKVFHRAFEDVVVAQGNHCARRNGELRHYESEPVEILHFPFRTPAQLENKIVKGGAAYERNKEVNVDVGHCWRSLYEEWKQRGLDQYISTQFLSKEQVLDGLRAGSLVEDTRLRDLLRTLR